MKTDQINPCSLCTPFPTPTIFHDTPTHITRSTLRNPLASLYRANQFSKSHGCDLSPVTSNNSFWLQDYPASKLSARNPGQARPFCPHEGSIFLTDVLLHACRASLRTMEYVVAFSRVRQSSSDAHSMISDSHYHYVISVQAREIAEGGFPASLRNRPTSKAGCSHLPTNSFLSWCLPSRFIPARFRFLSTTRYATYW